MSVLDRRDAVIFFVVAFSTRFFFADDVVLRAELRVALPTLAVAARLAEPGLGMRVGEREGDFAADRAGRGCLDAS